MIALNRNFINTSYQGFYEVIPSIGYTVNNTFNYVNKVIHSWILSKFDDERIPRNPKSWSWSGVSRSIDIHHDYDNKFYCMKITHTDEKVASRIWTVEASAFIRQKRLFLASRTSYTSEDRDRDYHLCNPPRFINTISARCNLCDAGESLDELHSINTDEDVEKLFLIINDKDRVFPVIVVSEDQSQNEDIRFLQSSEEGYHIDGTKLALSLKQIAHVYYLPEQYQEKWVNMMSKKWGVSNGAVRTYNPGFDIDSEEEMAIFDHPIALPKNILLKNYINEDGRELIAGHAFRHMLAQVIKRDNMYRKFKWEENEVKFYNQIIKEADSEAIKDIDALHIQIQQYKKEIDESKSFIDMYDAENEELREKLRKRNVENILNQQRIIDLETQLKQFRNSLPIEYPKTYDDIQEWVTEQFAGRLELHKKAVKCLKNKPEYQDIELLCKAIEFLGKNYYEMKTGRLDRKIYETTMASLGIENSLTGSEASSGRQSEAYKVDYNGARRRLDMHIKGGKSMNSSDPRERFRIYYFWDDEDQRVIIGYLPDHLPLSEN